MQYIPHIFVSIVVTVVYGINAYTCAQALLVPGNALFELPLLVICFVIAVAGVGSTTAHLDQVQ